MFDALEEGIIVVKDGAISFTNDLFKTIKERLDENVAGEDILDHQMF